MLGLPGNPVSAGVTALLFLLPAMEIMAGRDRQDRAPESAALGVDLKGNGERQDYMRAKLSANAGGRLTATPFDEQDSSMLALFAKADCLIVRPIGAPPAKEGDQVPIIRLDHGSISVGGAATPLCSGILATVWFFSAKRRSSPLTQNRN